MVPGLKLLFLDVDGVLNRAGTVERFKGMLGVEPGKVAIVNRIVDTVGCDVVVSSTWRLDNDHFLHIVDNINNVRGATKSLRGIRGDEVREFMGRKYYEGRPYAILDDDMDFYSWQPLFKTDWHTGITDEIADKVIEHFKVVA